MVNYQNGKVYKIWSTSGDKIYIGSTTKEYLSQRMEKHRYDYRYWKDGKRGLVTSFLLFDEYGLENCFIELLEAKSCNTKDELSQLEGKYIRSMVCVNKHIMGRTKAEYSKIYDAEHKEQRNQWKLDNKDYTADYKKKWHATHIDGIKERNGQVITCSCGKDYTNANRARHLKSVFHITNNKEQ